MLLHFLVANDLTIAHVANGLLQKARTGCTTSSIFYLKTQAQAGGRCSTTLRARPSRRARVQTN